MSLGGPGSTEDTDAADADSESIFTEINITPLTDVFLVLLVIFMVTTSVMNTQGMQVELPQASAVSSSALPEAVVITLLAEGRLQLNGQTFERSDWSTVGGRFDQDLKTAISQTSGKGVVLEGDRQAQLGMAVEVMDRSKKAGALQFSIATDSRNK